ncbi:MAG: ribulose-phosphate 3-epimerase [Planctomycetota bacterium]
MPSSKLDAIREAGPAILPSLLQCDFGDLRTEVQRLTEAGSSILHLDVMDGHFVPNLTYGMPIVEGLRRHTDLPLDVHLMIQDPLTYAPAFVDAGADMVTFHVEAVKDPATAITNIRNLGVGVGLAVNPDTPFDGILQNAGDVDMVLVMSVNAGFGGQAFNPIALDRIAELRSAFPDLLIEIDGGIKVDTIGQARSAGCDLFVVGSAIFGQDDYAAAIGQLESAMLSATSQGAS